MTKTLASSLVLGLLGLAGCPDIKTDPDELAVGDSDAPIVEFDPGSSIIPFPNNLVLDPATGKVALPKQCGEGPAQTVIRTNLLNTLDGFGTYESALQVTFSEMLDPASLTGHVLVYQLAKSGAGNDPTKATAIPALTIPGVTVRFDAACDKSEMVTALTIIAQGALEQRSTYVVALTKGVKTAGGEDFGASFTWSVISQAKSPVTFDEAGNVTSNQTPLDPKVEAQLTQLKGINQLWGVHKAPLDFLAATGTARSDVLIAWTFNTQSNDAIDPTVADSPAAKVLKTPLQGVASILPDGVTPTQFLSSRGIPCAGGVPCAAVGDIVAGGLISPSYQTDTANPLGAAGGPPVPGPWNNPSRPTVVHAANVIQFLAAVPSTPAPAAGYPTVVFGHGLGSSKTTLLAIASQLAQAGFASVAIDFVAHDSRAVRVSKDPARGCDDARTPAPTTAPQCFAPFLSSDLAGTRDNIRQTVLDLVGLVESLKACSTTMCGALKVDPAHLSYMGISLGGIVGATAVANIPDFKAAVLNVPGVGLVDVLENTANLNIRCSLVDALIGVGVVTGEPFKPATPTTPATGLCTTDAWKAQAGYQRFSAIARWALDPADGANFTRKLAAKKFLIQEVVNDQVVPNIATERMAALVGLMASAGAADPANVFAGLAPSVAITTNPTASKFVRYTNLAPGSAASPPGNTFAHSSLLAPAPTVFPPAGDPPAPLACNPGTGVACDGVLGTARVQTDAITFLFTNK
jgi:dienelactone hydrolase